MSSSRGRAWARGISSIEALIALPLLLLMGGAALQWMWVLHARQALGHAAYEAARSGSVAHADPEAIEQGLARGLLPWLAGRVAPSALEIEVERAQAGLRRAREVGWVRVVQLSPTQAAFDDWGQDARDAQGRPLAGVREIPNDDLVHRMRMQWPHSGARGLKEGVPIGQVSGQTLSEANVLRLRIGYGVPLDVPLIGRLIGHGLRVWHGCERPTPLRLGLVWMGEALIGPPTREDLCPMLGGTAADTVRDRIPVWAVATVRMHTPARTAGEEEGWRTPGEGTAASGPAPHVPPQARGPVEDEPVRPRSEEPVEVDTPPTVSQPARPAEDTRLLFRARRMGGSEPSSDGFCRLGDS